MKLKATQFHGFNEEMLNPKAVRPANLGASGVSNMRGFSADYDRKSANKAPHGAGVSSMSGQRKPEVIRPETYSLYSKSLWLTGDAEHFSAGFPNLVDHSAFYIASQLEATGRSP